MSKIRSIDVFFHPAGILPDAPEKTDQYAKTEEVVRAYCNAHKGKGSGPAVASFFSDDGDINFTDPVGFKKATTKEALIESFEGLPPNLRLELKTLLIASDETQAAALIDVILPDGGIVTAIDRIQLAP